MVTNNGLWQVLGGDTEKKAERFMGDTDERTIDTQIVVMARHYVRSLDVKGCFCSDWKFKVIKLLVTSSCCFPILPQN